MWVRLLTIIILLLSLMLLVCKAPTSSSSAENASIGLEFKSSSGKITKQTLTDTVGKQINVCLIHNLSQYIDAPTLKITMGNDFNKVYSVKSFKSLIDTTWFSMEFSAPGNYFVNFTAFIDGKPMVVNGTITIVEHLQTQNQKPVLTLPKEQKTGVGQELTFLVSAIDPDANQQVTISVVKKPESATFTANQFKWTPALADTGSDTVIFTAADNGTPALYATDSCVIVITATPVNRAPTWGIISLQRSSLPEALFSLDLSSYCSDPDNDNLTFSLLSEMPDNDTIVGNVYQFTPSVSDTGKNSIHIVATDPAGLKDTFTLELTISKTIISKPDQVPPVITFKSPSKDTVIAMDSCEVMVTCIDDSGCSVFGYRDGIAFEMKKSASVSNRWTGMAKGISAGAYSMIKFIATDSSAARNKDSVTVRIKYDNDITKPAVTLVKPTAKSTTTNASSYSIELKYTDKSGVLSVTGVSGTNTVSGVRSGENWVVTFNSLIVGENKIYITATDSSLQANKTIDTIIVNYDPTLNDVTGPVITLKSPAVDSTKVSSKTLSVEITCIDTSGVDTVTCKIGTTDVLVVKGTGDTYTASVTTLATGANTFIFIATDKASTKQSSTKSVTVIYDPKMIDNVQPKVVIKNPPNADQRVLTDTLTVQIECSDDSRISSVTATRGGAPVTGITNFGSLYSVRVAALRAGMSDTINFKVVDSSSNKNFKDFPVILRYNRQPAAATLSLPADGATGILKTGVFTWTNGDDPDGDAVTYTLRYGTSATALNSTISNLTAKTVSLTTGLNEATKYYWQVVTHTKANGDSAVSGIASFTTVEDKPVISVEPTTQYVIYGNKATFSVTVTGLNVKYQWYKGIAAITGATFQSYTTQEVSATDDGSTYYCIASNGGGDIKSSTVSLVVEYWVTYDINGAENGTAPVDNSTYAKGKSATVKAGTGLTRSNYTFGGWVRHGVNNSKVYKADDSLMISSGNVTMDAVWNTVTYTLTYNGNGSTGGSAPATVTGILSGTPVTVSGAGSLLKTNSEFLGWNTDATATTAKYTASSPITISANTTLFAIWKMVETFTVKFDTQGGSSVAQQTVRDGGYVQTPSSPTLNNCKFSDWYKEPQCFNKWNFNTNVVTSDITLFAGYTVTDVDGNTYKSVLIGSQRWMAENLKTTRFNDGTPISMVSDSATWGALTTPGYCWYKDSISYGAIYGALYNFHTVNTGKLAPKGWHVPTDSEWTILTTNLGGENVAGGKLKEAGTTHWKSPNTEATNDYGFSAIPGGSRINDGEFLNLCSLSSWWSATAVADRQYALFRCLYYDKATIYSTDLLFRYGFSVRCVRD